MGYDDNNNAPSLQNPPQPTCCPTCCTVCSNPDNSDPYKLYHKHSVTLNRVLFKFLNYSATRISLEIAQAWSNETEQVKREYEIQALRERDALELKTFPDYQYTKSSLAFNSGGTTGEDEGGLSLDLKSMSLRNDGILKKD
ncbi:hypothetical protein BG015_001021 [Linnemannia schmuckeri]|uniref:Uncharacterized protein n=1 Tax=Linnemannia schmuckeri TaxID=64567 RepID=A0A9P5V722_9FUNG|nr:hypothetical protein BG015_001021 [Linnemannia schmuckeri]